MTFFAFRLAASILSTFIASSVSAAGNDIVCIGDPGATKQAVFLHGMITETKEKGPQPNYRTLLEKVAKDAKMRIAMPVSKDTCRGDASKRCWNGNDGKAIAAIWHDVLASSGQCIDTKKSFGLIGHSNGGYMAGRIIMRCLKPQPKWAIVGGAAGDISHTVGVEPKDCAALTVFMGKKDLTNQKAKNFVGQLRANKRKATFVEYKGAHDFQVMSLVELILGLEKTGSNAW